MRASPVGMHSLLGGMLDECTIFVVRGTTARLEGIYGHELMHCMYGTYHKEL